MFHHGSHAFRRPSIMRELTAPDESRCVDRIRYRRSTTQGQARPSSMPRGVHAWFSGRLVLESVDLRMDAVVGDGAHRSVGLRQVDLPADPEPHARGRSRGPAGRHGRARRRRHLRAGPAGHRHPAPHRHGLPEAQPVPGHDDRRQRAVRAQVLPDVRSPTRTTWSRRCSPRPACGTR